MLARLSALTLLLLSAGVSTVGCAQWQQDSDDLAAAAFDERLFARVASVLGEQSPHAVAQASRPQAPRVREVADQQLSARRKPDPAKSSVRQIAAAEPLDAAAPMPAAEPIETALQPSDQTETAVPLAGAETEAQKPPDAHIHSATCDDACCQAEFASPLDRPCPILGACGGCPACLAGRRCAKLFTRPEPGPPPIRYRPGMPPKFLPVPTQPVLSPARPDAPDPRRGNVEFSWRHELMFPGDD
jgi:hypothetical protein